MNLTLEKRFTESAAQMVAVSANASATLEECRRSVDFLIQFKYEDVPFMS
jgi:hypothetical protein